MFLDVEVHWSVFHLEWIDIFAHLWSVTPLISHLESIGSLNFTDLLNLNTVHFKISKNCLLITSVISMEKSKYWEAVKLMLKDPNFLLSNQYCRSSCLKCQAHLICFQGMVYKMSTKVWKIIVHLSAVVSIKYGPHEEPRELGFQANHRRTFPLNIRHASVCSRNASWDMACHHKASQKVRASQVH